MSSSKRFCMKRTARRNDLRQGVPVEVMLVSVIDNTRKLCNFVSASRLVSEILVRDRFKSVSFVSSEMTEGSIWKRGKVQMYNVHISIKQTIRRQSLHT